MSVLGGAVSSLKSVGVVCVLAVLGFGYASVIDRSSSWALSVVELDSGLPTPLWAIALGGAVLAFGVDRLQSMFNNSPASPPGRAPVVRKRSAVHGASDRDGLLQRIRSLPLPSGARLLMDDPPTVPLHLIVEEAPEKRVKRAVSALGVLLAGLPLPPRIRVSMRRCPDPLTPWHHIVGAALADHMPRSEFKVVPGLDGVDVMFHRPDPMWKR